MRKRETVFVVIVQKKRERMAIMSTDSELLAKYVIVDFIQKIGGIKLKRRGAKVGEWLVVAFPSPKEPDQYKIFKLHNGEPVINAVLVRLKDALGLAELLNKTYKEYMLIWKEYPDADIIGLARWTDKNSIALYKIAQDMAKQNKIDTPEIQKIFQQHHFAGIM